VATNLLSILKGRATKEFPGATVKTVNFHDIFRGDKGKIVFCHFTPSFFPKI
jgi:hypothetical protein